VKLRYSVSASNWAAIAVRNIHWESSQTMPKQITGVHLAAYFGLRDTLMALLKKGYRSDIKDTFGRTPTLIPKMLISGPPLWRASLNEHEAVVLLHRH